MAAPSRPQVPAIFSQVRCHTYASPPPTMAPQITCMAPVPMPRKKIKEKMSGSVLNQIADILKGGKGKCNDDGSIFYRHRFRLKYKKIKEQRQEFHHFFYHRCDLCGGGNRICCVKSGKEGIDVSGEQACPHSCKTA